MKRFITLVSLLACGLLTWSGPAAGSAQPVVADKAPLTASQAPAQGSIRFSIIKTAQVKTREGLAYSGGSLFKEATMNHTAVLVSHPKGSFLFDTGLGEHIDAQFGQDMPWWAKPFFTYGKVTPARRQLDAAGLPAITRIILSHGHWDHASGLEDFPEAEVWLPSAEREFLDHEHPGAVLPSQITPPSIRWKAYDLTDRPYATYPRSHDLFGDGRAVLVSMPGHTPGSVGLFLTVSSGKQYFFVGDTVWRLEAAKQVRPKFWVASRIVDHDRPETLAGVQKLHAVMSAQPALVVVPAHDASVHDELGYFPQWVE
ncbi:MBL fold metallo-hydrolase [bacterium]|nr:MBL fold metallo-hydrolase [bacterium]